MQKIISYLPMVAVVVLVLAVGYIGGLQEKKTAEMDASDGQQSIVYLKK